MNTKPWEIDWRIIRADKKDVAFAKTQGEKIGVGDEMGRFAQSIGPLRIDHNHWGGWFIDGSRKQIEMASRCEQMFELLKRFNNNLIGNMKFLEELSQIVKEIEQYDQPADQG